MENVQHNAVDQYFAYMKKGVAPGQEGWNWFLLLPLLPMMLVLRIMIWVGKWVADNPPRYTAKKPVAFDEDEEAYFQLRYPLFRHGRLGHPLLTQNTGIWYEQFQTRRKT